MLLALFALSVSLAVTLAVAVSEASASPLAGKVRRMREVKELNAQAGAKAQEAVKGARAMLAAPEEGARKHRAFRARTGGSAMASRRMR